MEQKLEEILTLLRSLQNDVKKMKENITEIKDNVRKLKTKMNS